MFVVSQLHTLTLQLPLINAESCTVSLVDDIIREQVARAILDFVLPTVRATPTPSARIPTPLEDDIDHVYRDLVQTFNQSTNSEGHAKFIAA